MASQISIKFWGTRGLISAPSTEMAIFGGNTTCIQIIHDDMLILIDTGFGASQLGERLMKRILKDKESLQVHIFYTHFHWDHIQGLPFFHPIYFPSSTLHIYSPTPPEDMVDSLDVLFDGSYSPFSGIAKMPSKIHFKQLQGAFCLGNLMIDYVPVQHGNDSGTETYAYKITAHKNGATETVVVVTDHEAMASPRNDEVVAFAKGCDLLIHDGQYTEAEYKRKRGWGHSTMKQALANALRINPRKTLLTHHDPSHTDRMLLDAWHKLKAQKTFKALDFEFAREDHIYEVRELVPADTSLESPDENVTGIKKAG